MPGVVRARRVDPLAVEPEDPVEEAAGPRDDHCSGAEAAERARTEREPETDAERDDEQPAEIRGELVVEPRTAGGQRAEVGEIVVGGAERGRLDEVTGDPAGVERQEGDETAEAEETRGSHARTLTPFDHPAPACLDSPGLPDDDGEGPGGDEERRDDVADAAEVEVVEEGPEASLERELRRRHLQELDRADDQRDRD